MRVITPHYDVDVLGDGITHINIYTGGKTELGRFLSNFTHMEQDTEHGRFSSLEGYYHYLKLMRAVNEADIPDIIRIAVVKDIDRLRTMFGKQAQDYGRELRQRLIYERIWINDKPNEFFHECFRKAMLTKIETSSFKDVFFESDLPFTHYYVFKGSVIYKPHFSWLEDLVNDLRYGVKHV